MHGYRSVLLTVVLATTPSGGEPSDQPARMSEIEWGSDRQGGDYRGFLLAVADPTLCEEQCARERPCAAWAYVKPNTTQGPRPRCWLKNRVPEKRDVTHCVSGTKLDSVPTRSPE